MEFKIPVRREDLLHSSCLGQYTVQEVLTVREICRKQGECRTALREQGGALILDYFDYFYSCLSEHCHLEHNVKGDAWNILTEAFRMFLNDLSLNLEDESLDGEDRLRFLNMLKMFCYLICHWMPLFEEDANQQDNLLSKRGKGKKKTSKEDDSKGNWVQEQCKIIELIEDLVKTSFQKLWIQNQMEDEFLNLLINCCFKFLENPQLCKHRESKELVFEILGKLFKNQKHSIGHAVKIVQLLQLFEHMPNILAQAVVIFVNSYKMNQMLSDIIREIGNASAQDSLQNNSGNRAFSLFLAEIAKQMPNSVLPNISYLATHLDGESYCMRNCVLGIMSEILLQVTADNDNDSDNRVRSLREQFLDHLEDHIHDVNAFVRSRCLQIWTQLCESQAIPIPRQQRLLDLIVDRLHDKSCSVRKCAVRFLTSILQNNPFAAKISLSELQENVEKETVKLQEMLNAMNLNDDNKENLKNNAEQENEQSAPYEENVPIDISKQKVLIKYLNDSIVFAKAVAKALPLVCHLLYSSQVTDVMEAISFFVTAFKFGVHNSIIGIQKMLTLVWSAEPDLKNAVMTAYKSLYLHSDNASNKKNDIASNLIRLTMNATIGEIASLELLIHDLVKSGEIEETIIDTLWKRFYHQMKYSNTESHAAIILIGMAASARYEIVEQKLNIIDEVGLGSRSSKDFFFARDVCCALLKLGTKLSTDGTKTTFYLPHDHIIFKHISEIVIGGIKSFNDNSWVSMAQQAVDFIYKISDKPAIICENILIDVVEMTKTPSTNENNQFLDNVPSKLLANILLLSSHISLCQMLHLEVSVFNELKRRRQIKEEEQTANSVKKQKRKSKNARDSIRESMCETNGEDHGLNSAIAEDIDAEFIRKVCDKELLTGNEKLLSILAQIAVVVSGDPIKYSNKYLKTASTFALAKFMMVSQDFCEANIQLLFTVLEKSDLPSIRATLMIAVCDLACRFPNIIEPWTSHIFKRVRDESFEVRENSIAVLGHLLFNDMIKVKGCASEIALCIVDEDLRIQMKAKQLFSDLSQKNNAIFNLMPDIIGRLIDAYVGTTEENFQTIMKFLLEFVKKDRLLESLVEKICQRFTVVRLEWQWRCLAFSLTLVVENEKCCRKLLENISLFQDSIAEEIVYLNLNTIISNARKTLKEEFQPLINEIEEQLELIRNKALGEEGVEKHIDRVPIRKNKIKVRRNVKEHINRKQFEEDSPKVENKVKTRSQRNRKGATALVFSSDDDFDDK